DAVIFEEFIQKKYVGAKSFSLEGSESLIPLLDLAIEQAGVHDIREIVLGMAHRGRLNVLANIMGKSPQQIFREFEDVDPQFHDGRGDVKYHLGYSSDWRTTGGENIHLSLCFNPSHLEFVNPVAVGRMRAKQDRARDLDREHGLVILIHGDAAFAGEGIVQETLNMSELEGYRIGGTIHVIVNNQIGFTTTPEQGRSSVYASGLAKMLQIPIFHVNGEDPEAVAQVIRLAMDFRQTFKRDVVIDMYGYRRHGHNEGDEPAFTQPLLYRAIAQRKSVREGYLEHLLALDGVTREEADSIAEERRKHLDEELSVARSEDYVQRAQRYTGIWSGYRGGPESETEDVETGVIRERLEALLEKLSRTPEDFHPHKRLVQLLKQRHEMAEGERPLDWSAGEALAFATLLTEGLRVRLSGQDSERGTFSHRHAVLRDIENGGRYVMLAHLASGQAPFEVINSPLSENGVLGFEYGYSLDWPDALVCWEAQFGDFVNAAQVIIDQFLASAEDKWNRLSGLVLLLPHGFEGQGPEHSSARLERFLTLAAEDNIQVAYPTTPAQYFHLLRRQVVRPWRKPLVVMTPKSLLRHPRVVSSLEEFTFGQFQRVIADDLGKRKAIKRVLLCSGKIFYELHQAREERKRSDVAIVRVEQLYPLADKHLEETLKVYADGTPAFWVQEEPDNMGAWRFIRYHMGDSLFGRLPFSGISRPASASPATGSASSHKLEQQKIIDEAFGE
ncbi:MAG: 2-oxoglutarate dehydrogenase E1 component, partial [Bryobacterales bacterium]